MKPGVIGSRCSGGPADARVDLADRRVVEGSVEPPAWRAYGGLSI
jgi:hypothetical protein